MNKLRIFTICFFTTLIFAYGGRSEVIRQDKLSATTMSPSEGETQYVGSFYTNGGIYSIILTKTQKTSGSVKVEYTRSTYMDDGSKRKIGGGDTWIWNPDEQSTKPDSGAMWLNAQYQSDEVGPHTWSTRIYWDGWEYTGTGWKYIGGGSTINTNNFTVAEPGGCS